MKVVAVVGAVLSVSPAAGSSGVGGVASFTGTPSTKVRAGAPIYRGPTGATVSGVTNPAQGATIPSPPLAAILTPSSTKVRAESQAPLRVDDEVTVVVFPAQPGTPPVPVPTSMTIKVTAAGQSKVRAA